MSEEELEYSEESEFTQVEIDKDAVLNDIKLKNADEITVKPKKKRKSKVNTSDISSMSEDEAFEASPDDVKELYDELYNFLEKTTDLKLDSGAKDIIPTGIDLVDAILGGGFASGALNVVIGPPGSGKSMFVGQFLGTAQKKYNGDIAIIYLDAEYSMSVARLFNLGVCQPKIRPHVGVTVEKLFQLLESICTFKDKRKEDNPAIIVWDSIANTMCNKELETDDLNKVMGFKSRLYSFLVPKYVMKLSQYNICLLAINQLRDIISINPYNKPTNDLKYMNQNQNMPGGKSIKFNTFQLIELKQKSFDSKLVEKIGYNGIMSGMKCIKNKLYPSNIDVEIIGGLNRGFSNFWSNYKFLMDKKKIDTGQWHNLVNYPTKKYRVKDAPSTYESDVDFKTAFDELVKETIRKEIIEPNEI